jgi:hypothetical protein
VPLRLQLVGHHSVVNRMQDQDVLCCAASSTGSTSTTCGLLFLMIVILNPVYKTHNKQLQPLVATYNATCAETSNYDTYYWLFWCCRCGRGQRQGMPGSIRLAVLLKQQLGCSRTQRCDWGSSCAGTYQKTWQVGCSTEFAAAAAGTLYRVAALNLQLQQQELCMGLQH